jgi:hypothetical protein
MALTSQISPAEMARVAAAAYEGRAVRVSLASVGTSGFTAANTTAEWDSLKISGNGYTDFNTTVAVGGYDAVDGRYELGSSAGANTYIQAEFTATGGSLTYDRIYVVIGSEIYIHSLLSESPAVTLAAGQTVLYRIQLAVSP